MVIFKRFFQISESLNTKYIHNEMKMFAFLLHLSSNNALKLFFEKIFTGISRKNFSSKKMHKIVCSFTVSMRPEFEPFLSTAEAKLNAYVQPTSLTV